MFKYELVDSLVIKQISRLFKSILNKQFGQWCEYKNLSKLTRFYILVQTLVQNFVTTWFTVKLSRVARSDNFYMMKNLILARGMIEETGECSDWMSSKMSMMMNFRTFRYSGLMNKFQCDSCFKIPIWFQTQKGRGHSKWWPAYYLGRRSSTVAGGQDVCRWRGFGFHQTPWNQKFFFLIFLQ